MRKTRKARPRGRPTVGTETVTFRLDTELYERIEKFAEREQRPLSNAIRLLLEAGLDSQTKK
jgi:predicted DNA-binding protein